MSFEEEVGYAAITVAQAFVDLASAEGGGLTNMQLQKLVFISHGVHLAAFDKPLILEAIKAWNFGPVIPELYETLRKFGSRPVSKYLGVETSAIKSNDSANCAVNEVWKILGRFGGWQLSEITHQKGSPWDQVWNKQGDRYGTIPNGVIKAYYKPLVKVSG